MKHILIIATSHALLGTTGRPTGAYVPELAEPYQLFVAQGYKVTIASVQGGVIPLDGIDPKQPAVTAFLANPTVAAQLKASPRADKLDPANYDAILFAGGHGTMWDFPKAQALGALATAIYARGGIVAAVCHGPAALLAVKSPDGQPLVSGKRVAAFTNDEERAVGLAQIVPFLLHDALAAQGARLTSAVNFKANVVADGRLVTGQNPASAQGVAEAMVKLLKP